MTKQPAKPLLNGLDPLITKLILPLLHMMVVCSISLSFIETIVFHHKLLYAFFFSGKVKEMLRAHDYDEVKTLENLKNAMLSKEMDNIPILTVIETTETGTIFSYTRNLHKLKRFFNCILY